MSAVVERHRFNVTEYYRMAETGILQPKARVELIEGEICDMAPIGVGHGSAGDRIAAVLSRRLADRAIIRSQYPVRLSELSEPQPDIAVLRPKDNWYADAHPAPADVQWLIEIADTSLNFDRGEKLALYARHGIAEVWIVNLPQLRLELYAGPQADRYVETRVILPGQRFAGRALPQEIWTTAELLGWTTPSA